MLFWDTGLATRTSPFLQVWENPERVSSSERLGDTHVTGNTVGCREGGEIG